MSVINVDVYVPNLATIMGLFDEVQVHRSTTTEDGTYTEITGAAAAAAEVTGTEVGPFTLNGLTVLVKVDEGSEQTLTFATADPISVDDVVDTVNAGLTGVTASESAGALVLTSDTTGTGSTIEITGGTALTEIGFTATKYYGVADRITLNGGQTDYTLVDHAGDADFYYKSRFYNSQSTAVSSFSDPIQGDVSSIVPSGDLVQASATFARLDGTPIEGLRVSFHNVYSGPALQASSIGVVGQTVLKETDAAGYLETMLVVGAVVDVSIAGTAITRRITVPSSDFDLMDQIAAADDIFQIHTYTIPAAPRRS